MTKRTHTFLMAEIVTVQMMEQEGMAASYTFMSKQPPDLVTSMKKELAISNIVACAGAVTAAWLSATTLIVPEMAGSKKALASVNAMYRTVMKSIAKHIERAVAS